MGDDQPLTVTGILRHGATWNGDREVVTAEDEQSTSRVSFAEVGAGAAQLAHALRYLGVDGDDRVGTYLWNNREHLEAYLAVPAMGAVLHTANIRLFADELVHTVNQAQDRILLVDADLLDSLAPSLGRMPTVRAIVVRGQPRRPPPRSTVFASIPTTSWSGRSRVTSPGPTWTSARPPPSASRRGRRATRRASRTATGRFTCTRCPCARPTRSR